MAWNEKHFELQSSKMAIVVIVRHLVHWYRKCTGEKKSKSIWSIPWLWLHRCTKSSVLLQMEGNALNFKEVNKPVKNSPTPPPFLRVCTGFILPDYRNSGLKRRTKFTLYPCLKGIKCLVKWSHSVQNNSVHRELILPKVWSITLKDKPKQFCT